VLPRRWLVERSFSWFGRNRRLAKDFENLAETLGAFVALASIPACSQAACQGVGRARRNDGDPQRGGDLTFIKALVNGEIAPIPAVRGTAMEPRDSTLSRRS